MKKSSAVFATRRHFFLPPSNERRKYITLALVIEGEGRVRVSVTLPVEGRGSESFTSKQTRCLPTGGTYLRESGSLTVGWRSFRSSTPLQNSRLPVIA